MASSNTLYVGTTGAGVFSSGPHLAVSKQVDNPHPIPGDSLVYTILISHTGTLPISNGTVKDNLSGNLTFVGSVSIEGGGSAVKSDNPPKIVKDLAIEAGTTVTVSFPVRIANGLDNGTVISNMAVVDAPQLHTPVSGSTGIPPQIATGLGLNSGRKLTIKFPARVNDHVLPGTTIDNTAYVTSYPWPVPISSQTSLTVGDLAARHIYVDVEAVTSLKNGSSWENAYTSLQDALLNAGSGSEIWVAAGAYYPDVGIGLIDNDPAATFHLRSGVAVYGGFAGTENSLDEREPASNVTVLSGDIDGNDTGECGLGTGADHIKGTNRWHVVTGSGTTSSALLDGFTITSGHAEGTARNGNGGGMFNEKGSPTLTNIRFCGNKAEGSGGGMYNLNNSRPTITNSIFWQNQDDNGFGAASATIRNDASSIPLIGYSLVQSSGGSGLGWNGSIGFDQGQNIDDDPLFVTAGDRHLRPGSPAIDAGDNAVNSSEHDLDVKPRISDGTNDGEAKIDLGAEVSDEDTVAIEVRPGVYRSFIPVLIKGW